MFCFFNPNPPPPPPQHTGKLCEIQPWHCFIKILFNLLGHHRRNGVLSGVPGEIETMMSVMERVRESRQLTYVLLFRDPQWSYQECEEGWRMEGTPPLSVISLKGTALMPCLALRWGYPLAGGHFTTILQRQKIARSLALQIRTLA